MSIIVFYSGVLFNDGNTSDAGKYTMAAFTMIVNVWFIWYILYRLYIGAHMALDMHFIFFNQGSISSNRGADFPDGRTFCSFLRKLVAMIKYIWYHHDEAVHLSKKIRPSEERIPGPGISEERIPEA